MLRLGIVPQTCAVVGGGSMMWRLAGCARLAQHGITHKAQSPEKPQDAAADLHCSSATNCTAVYGTVSRRPGTVPRHKPCTRQQHPACVSISAARPMLHGEESVLLPSCGSNHLLIAHLRSIASVYARCWSAAVLCMLLTWMPSSLRIVLKALPNPL